MILQKSLSLALTPLLCTLPSPTHYMRLGERFWLEQYREYICWKRASCNTAPHLLLRMIWVGFSRQAASTHCDATRKQWPKLVSKRCLHVQTLKQAESIPCIQSCPIAAKPSSFTPHATIRKQEHLHVPLPAFSCTSTPCTTCHPQQTT